MGSRRKRLTVGILAAQCALMLGLWALADLLEPALAPSVFLGAAICLSANGFFALQLFRPYRATELRTLSTRIYGAEFAKLALVSVFFLLAFDRMDTLNMPALLATYVITQVLSVVLVSYGNQAGMKP